MISLPIRPHEGIGPVQFGMGRPEVAAELKRIGLSLSHSTETSDRFAENSLMVEYTDGTVSFVEVSASPILCGSFQGRDVHSVPAPELFALFAAGESTACGYCPEEFLFPDQILALWEADEQYNLVSGASFPVFGAVGAGDARYLEAVQ